MRMHAKIKVQAMIQTGMILALPSCGQAIRMNVSNLPQRHWESSHLIVDLTGSSDDIRSQDGSRQYYSIQDRARERTYHVPSFLDDKDIAKSFSDQKDSFGVSSIHFSATGRTAVIKDDTPSAASSDGHQLIIIRTGVDTPVMTTAGPDRSGILIEEWPKVVSIDDHQITFRYPEAPSTFSIPLATLLKTAKMFPPASSQIPLHPLSISQIRN